MEESRLDNHGGRSLSVGEQPLVVSFSACQIPTDESGQVWQFPLLSCSAPIEFSFVRFLEYFFVFF